MLIGSRQTQPIGGRCGRQAARLAGVLAALTAYSAVSAAPAAAQPAADVFNGRIGFTSFRVDHDPGPAELVSGDIFSVAPTGQGVRQLTDDPAYDAFPAWRP